MGKKKQKYGSVDRDLAIWLHSGLLTERGLYDQAKITEISRALKCHPSRLYKLAKTEVHFEVEEIPVIARILGTRVPPSCRW